MEFLTLALSRPEVIIGLALVIDLVAGDPVYRLHPIRLLGGLLGGLEHLLFKLGANGYFGGCLLFVLLSAVAVGVYYGLERAAFLVHPLAAAGWRLYVAWSLVALGDLCRHGRRIAAAVRTGDLERARECTQMLVSRDVDRMDLDGCCRAGIESVSENLVDGIISPLFWFFLLGFPGLVIFKVVSTMDSMVGYKNERYRRFGWCGARLDDVLNFIPARVAWLLMGLVCLFLPKYRAGACLRAGWRLHHLLPSPNSGWTEAAAAGALGIQLVGPIWYHGKLATDLWIGEEDARRECRPSDLLAMNRLAVCCTLAFTGAGAVARFGVLTALAVWRARHGGA